MNATLKNTLETLNGSDSEYWIDLYSKIPPHQVGVIKLSGKIIAGKNFEQLCAEIRTLSNHGLFLPIVIGGGVQYDQLPAYADSFKVNGLRVTSDALINELVQDGTIQGGMIINGRNGFDTLDYLGSDCSVQITSLVEDENIVSTGILEELLGNGSGTKLTIPSDVGSFNIDEVDYKILKYMINNSFSIYKQILVDNYFEIIAPRKPNIYIDEKERGGSITYHINSPQVNFEYLCKLFKQQGYDGLGIGTSLIYHILREKSSLAWRCDRKKIIELKFYDKIIEHYNGVREDIGKYVMFAIGIDNDKKDNVFEIINTIKGTLKKT